ncbi:MAG: hypothetical protein ABFD86_22965 [Bryobacteraceae bacterium]
MRAVQEKAMVKFCRRWPWFLTVLALVPGGALAQTRSEKVPLQIQVLADRAAGVPPEFSADILLKLAGDPDVRDRDWKIRTIEDAFGRSMGAQNAYRLLGGRHTATREYRQSWDHGLDMLSLQCRAVELMLDLDSGRARTLFERIRLPELPAPKCRDALVADLSNFYTTFSLVLQGGFSASDRKKWRDIEAIEEQIRQMRSPIQIAPMTKVILTAPVVSPEQKQRLLTTLAAVVSQPRLLTTDRQFAVYEGGIWALLYDLRNAHADLTDWIPAIRSLLVRQYAQPRCADHSMRDGLPEAAVEFNAFLDKLKRGLPFAAVPVHPIADAEIQPSEVAGSMELTELWQSADGAKILDRLRWLHHGNRGLTGPNRLWSASERSAMEWDAKCREALKLLDEMKEGEGAAEAAAVYHRKTTAYANILKLTPEGKIRENAAATLLAVLEHYYFRIENRSEWFSGFVTLQETALSKGGDSRLKAEIKQSKNPVISLYAAWLELTPHEE